MGLLGLEFSVSIPDSSTLVTYGGIWDEQGLEISISISDSIGWNLGLTQELQNFTAAGKEAWCRRLGSWTLVARQGIAFHEIKMRYISSDQIPALV